MDFVQQIYDFNQQAGLLDQPLDDYREASFAIEEALEGFNTTHLAAVLDSDTAAPKTIARTIVQICRNDESTMYPAQLSRIERVDKACDAIVFAVGYLAKCGLTVEQIHASLNIVMEANLQKLSMPRDSFGKLMKPANFVGPEERLAQLLEE